MQSFIVEFKQAFLPDFCDGVIAKFEKDPCKTPGRTGAGVDKSKKDSTDLYISDLPDWKAEVGIIHRTLIQALAQYARAFPFLVTGALSASIPAEGTGGRKEINHQAIGHLSDPQLQELVQSMYRVDEINVQKYQRGTGGYHHWHSEHYPHPQDPEQRSLHRVLLWLVYLNDVERGGETEFYYQQARVKAQKGSLVLSPCTFTHTHRGGIPESGDKYVLASWILYKDARTLFQPG